MELKIIGCSTTWTERLTSCYCLNKDTLIDCGDGSTKGFKKVDVSFGDIKDIFITHLHSDHTMGLVQFIYNLVYYSFPNRKINIYGPVGLTNILNVLKDVFVTGCYDKDIHKYFNIFEISDFSKVIETENFKVTPYSFDHGTIDDIGYIFDDGKIKLGLSGDCTLNKNVEEFISNCDISFVDCCDKTTTKNHMGVDSYKHLQSINKSCRLIATHCNEDIYNSSEELGIEIANQGKIYNF